MVQGLGAYSHSTETNAVAEAVIHVYHALLIGFGIDCVYKKYL